MNVNKVIATAMAVKEAKPAWIVRYVVPNSVGRVSVKMWESMARNCTWLGFSLSLQEVLDYDSFKREASRVTGAPFRYEPAERDLSGAAWLELLQVVTRYPDKKLTDTWGAHCPGATRFEPSRPRRKVVA